MVYSPYKILNSHEKEKFQYLYSKIKKYDAKKVEYKIILRCAHEIY